MKTLLLILISVSCHAQVTFYLDSVAYPRYDTIPAKLLLSNGSSYSMGQCFEREGYVVQKTNYGMSLAYTTQPQMEYGYLDKHKNPFPDFITVWLSHPYDKPKDR